LGKLPCLHRRELFKSGFGFEKEFHIFGLAFKKSGRLSDFWDTSRVFARLEFGAQRFGFSFSNTGASSGIGCKEGETPFLVCEQQLAPNVLAFLFEC
jgi:hypothetical protein